MVGGRIVVGAAGAAVVGGQVLRWVARVLPTTVMVPQGPAALMPLAELCMTMPHHGAPDDWGDWPGA